MRRGWVLVAVISVVLVAIQVSWVSPLRIEGAVVMAVWLWPLLVGLVASTPLAIGAGAIAGLLFDARVATPFGLAAIVGAALGAAISLLAKEGIGDLDGAAWWVPPALIGLGGLVAPALFAGLAAVVGHASLWRNSLGAAMVVNAVAFAVLARPLGRATASLARAGGFARR